MLPWKQRSRSISTDDSGDVVLDDGDNGAGEDMLIDDGE